jgi:hypothetical protein
MLRVDPRRESGQNGSSPSRASDRQLPAEQPIDLDEHTGGSLL